MRGADHLRAMLSKAAGPSREADVLTHAVLGYDTPRVSIYFPDGTLQHWWKFAGSDVVSHITDPLHYIRTFADPKHRVPEYTASVDHALGLAERALPGWQALFCVEDDIHVNVYREGPTRGKPAGFCYRADRHLALAITSAVVDAATLAQSHVLANPIQERTSDR